MKKPRKRKKKKEQLILAELQVLLAELRTHLSLVRTGAGMIVGVISVTFLLLANGEYLPTSFDTYDYMIYGILGILALTGIFLFIRSERKIMAIMRLIHQAERRNKRIDQIMV